MLISATGGSTAVRNGRSPGTRSAQKRLLAELRYQSELGMGVLQGPPR